VFNATGAVMRAVSAGPFVSAILVLPSMSERVTVQGKIGISATTNPFDERFRARPNTGSTLQPGGPQANIRKRFKPPNAAGTALRFFAAQGPGPIYEIDL
jgi:hypothetical protein